MQSCFCGAERWLFLGNCEWSRWRVWHSKTIPGREDEWTGKKHWSTKSEWRHCSKFLGNYCSVGQNWERPILWTPLFALKINDHLPMFDLQTWNNPTHTWIAGSMYSNIPSHTVSVQTYRVKIFQAQENILWQHPKISLPFCIGNFFGRQFHAKCQPYSNGEGTLKL